MIPFVQGYVVEVTSNPFPEKNMLFNRKDFPLRCYPHIDITANGPEYDYIRLIAY